MSISDLKIIRYAKQTIGLEQNVTSSLVDLCTEGLSDDKLGQTKLDRDLRCGDNVMTSRILGPKDPGISFSTEAHGLYTVAADAVVAVAGVTNKALLEGVFGVAGDLGTGDTVSSASALELTVAGSALVDGDFVLVTGATSGNRQVREIASGGGTTTPDIDRALTQVDNSTEDPATGVVWNSAVYRMTDTNADLDTLFFDIEGDTERHRLRGGTVTGLTINVPSDGGRVMYSWEVDGNDWDRTTLANPTYSAENDGTVAIAVNSPVWIDATMYMVRDLTISISRKSTRKVTQFGINGYYGHGTVGSEVSISGSLYIGASDLEAAAGFRDTLNSATTKDILIQVGDTAGSCIGFRIPDGDCSAEHVVLDGLDGISFEAKATRTTQGGVTVARLAIF